MLFSEIVITADPAVTLNAILRQLLREAAKVLVFLELAGRLSFPVRLCMKTSED